MPKHSENILDILLKYLYSEHLDYAVELAIAGELPVVPDVGVSSKNSLLHRNIFGGTESWASSVLLLRGLSEHHNSSAVDEAVRRFRAAPHKVRCFRSSRPLPYIIHFEFLMGISELPNCVAEEPSLSSVLPRSGPLPYVR